MTEGESARRGVAESIEGTSTADFGLTDWGQLLLAAGIFGSAFLWIALALRSVHPGAVAFGRLALGAAALSAIPRARCRVDRRDRGRMLLAGLFGSAAPAVLFALAEQRISSALAGMLISGVPVATAALTVIVTRTRPSRRRMLGLVLGFGGIVLLTLPDLRGAGAEPIGVGMVVAAVVCYAVASMQYAPLQQTYGALPVTMWSLVAAAAMTLPLGVLGIADSRMEPLPIVALAILGVVGTGIAWAMFVSMVGRVGAVRASIAGYIIPLVALVLGVVALDEHIEAIQIVGVAVTLSGGWLLSRGRGAH